MTHKRIAAALALAFALGISISFANFSNDPSASASENSSELDDASSSNDTSDISSDQLSGNQADMDSPMTPDQSSDSTATNDTTQDTPTEPAPQVELSGVVEVDNQALLSQAMISSQVTEIVLTDDIVIPVNVSKSGGILFYRPLELAPLQLNLNGHSITTEGPYAMHVFYGDLDIVGQGTISAKSIAIDVKGSADPSYTKYTGLTIGKDVTISAPGAYSLVIDQTSDGTKFLPYAYGVKVEFNGTINAKQGPYINGSIQHTENAVNIKIGDTAVINVEEVAIYAAGYANWYFGSANISGSTGIGLKAGTFEFNNTTINASGAHGEPEVSGGGMDDIGAVFQIEHNQSYADEDINITINSGTFTSSQSDVFHEYGATSARSTVAPANIDINGGTFVAGAGHKIFGGTATENDIEISAGTFKGDDATTDNFQSYFTGNFKLNADGTVVANTPVVPDRPSSGGGTTTPSSPVTPSDPETPSTDGSTPGTGVNQGRGALNAVSTTIPLALGTIFIVAMVYGRKLLSRLKVARLNNIDCEITAEVASIIEDEPEPVIERFVATKISREDPQLTPVDTFISSK